MKAKKINDYEGKFIKSELGKAVSEHRPIWPSLVTVLLGLGLLGVLFGLPFIHLENTAKSYVYSFTYWDLLIGKTSTYNFYNAPAIAGDVMQANFWFILTVVLLLVGLIFALISYKGSKACLTFSVLFLAFSFLGVFGSLSEAAIEFSFTDKAKDFVTFENGLAVLTYGSPRIGLGALIALPYSFVLIFLPLISNGLSKHIAIARFDHSVKVGKKLLNY